jgi:hypothetical protein
MVRDRVFLLQGQCMRALFSPFLSTPQNTGFEGGGFAGRHSHQATA